VNERLADLGKDLPTSRCFPPGVPLMQAVPAPFKIVQTPGLVVILYEGWTIYRQIFTDGRGLPKDPNPSWMGYSVGSWNGDTLVVETAGLNDKSWLDLTGHPHSEALHVVERFGRSDLGRMEIQITIGDPSAYRKPWTVTEGTHLLPDTELLELSATRMKKTVRIWWAGSVVKLRLILLVIGLVAVSAAQAPPRSAFEVASVKRNLSGEGRIYQTLQPGGRYVAINIPLRMLIMRAYRLLEFRLWGGPDWINTERYDIVGLAPGVTDSDEITPRLQSLLAERFKLAAHMEKKEVSVLWLVRADKDGRLGPKFHTSTAGCPPLSPPPECIMKLTSSTLVTGGSPLIAFVNALSQYTGKIVVDRTGLSGLFEADLRWTPDLPSRVVPTTPGGPETPPADSNGPSLTTALQQQLGLKLESRKELVDMLVVDGIEHPTEN
jgi:uncharacterized protein (TIGR03435 family)